MPSESTKMGTAISRMLRLSFKESDCRICCIGVLNVSIYFICFLLFLRHTQQFVKQFCHRLTLLLYLVDHEVYLLLFLIGSLMAQGVYILIDNADGRHHLIGHIVQESSLHAIGLLCALVGCRQYLALLIQRRIESFQFIHV